MQEVTGSSPVPSTKTRASDLGQGLFCCVTHHPTSEQDGTGLEQQRSRPPPAAETGRRGWGRVLIFQGPVKGLRKNQQTQLVRAAHLSYSFCRNVYQESTACRSTVCRASVHAVPDRNNVRQSHSQKTKAGYHHDGGILPFALRDQVCFVRTWSTPCMAALGQSLRTQEKGQALTYRGVLSLAGVIYSAQQIGI